MKIRKYGDPVLERPAVEVDGPSPEVVRLLDDMLETMHEAGGIGLAAPQVGVSSRVVVVEVDGLLLRMLNPRIVEEEGRQKGPEGCLSLPGIEGDVERAMRVVVEYLDEQGERRRLEGEGLLARCIQHELDHLDGILFIRRLGAAARLLLKRKLARLKRETEAELARTGG